MAHETSRRTTVWISTSACERAAPLRALARTVGGVKLETARSTVEELGRRQGTLDGRIPQSLSGKSARGVLQKLPHVDHTVTVMMEKNGQTTTHTREATHAMKFP